MAAGRVGCRIEGVNVQDSTARRVTTVQKTTALARETVATAADLPAGTAMSEDSAARGRGARRPARTASATTSAPSAWALGDVTVSFPADAFKNANVTLADGTVTIGRRRASRSTLTFTVQGATARLVDPGAGGTIDVNVLNDRNWIDVQFVAPTGLKIDAGSITDLDPEFTLTGPGIGSIALDAARAPSLHHGRPGRRTARRSPTATG